MKPQCIVYTTQKRPSHLARGAWIETNKAFLLATPSWSHLARGAWIETRIYFIIVPTPSRTSQGVRGLKQEDHLPFAIQYRRTSQGVRGLKHLKDGGITAIGSRTSQGVRGLKHKWRCPFPRNRKSHLARGAWIETLLRVLLLPGLQVAPRKGCVD